MKLQAPENVNYAATVVAAFLRHETKMLDQEAVDIEADGIAA